MTVLSPVDRRPDAAEGRLLVLAAAAGLVALAARGVSWRAVWVTVMIAATSAVVPRLTREDVSIARAVWVGAVGVAAFGFVRLSTVALPLHATTLTGAASLVGGLAEEAFFRRFLYDVLARRGAAFAVAGTAAAFALIHIPAYGVSIVPLDLTAGLILGWQRWASGTWTVPGATHVVANLLSMA